MGIKHVAKANGAIITDTIYNADHVIDGHVKPDTDNTYDLGSLTEAWRDNYIDGVVYTDAISEFTGAAGITLNHNTNLGVTAASRTITGETLGAAATTFIAVGEMMEITGDVGANVVATITGGRTGQELTLFFVDALVTITDNDAHGANSVDCAGVATDFVSADDTVLTLVFDGTSWYEKCRSVN